MKRLSILIMVTGLFALVLSTAFATAGTTNTNSTDYWLGQYPNAIACYKSEGNTAHGSITNSGNAVTLNTYGANWPGDFYEVLIVKGGSVDRGAGAGNVVYPYPSAGVAYFAPLNAGGQQSAVSHWIVCKGEEGTTTTVPEVTTTVPEVTTTVPEVTTTVPEVTTTVPEVTTTVPEVTTTVPEVTTTVPEVTTTVPTPTTDPTPTTTIPLVETDIPDELPLTGGPMEMFGAIGGLLLILGGSALFGLDKMKQLG